MRAILLRVAAVVLILAGAVPRRAQSAQLSTQEIFNKWSRAVVTIRTSDGSGTGFFDNYGFLYTAYHVLAGAESATITFADGRTGRIVGALAANEAKDYAVLLTDTKIIGPALGDYAALQPGVRLTVIGSPLGLSQTVTEGIVSAKRADGQTRHLQLSAGVSHGSSGSPVFNTAGYVVGMVVSTLTDGQLLNFALSSADLKEASGVPLRSAFAAARASDGLKGSLLASETDIDRQTDLISKGADKYVGLKRVKLVIEPLPEPLQTQVTGDEVRLWLTDCLTNGGLEVMTSTQYKQATEARPATPSELDRLKWCDSFYATIICSFTALKQSDGTVAYRYDLQVGRAGVLLPGWITSVTVDTLGGVAYAGPAANLKDQIRRAIESNAASIVSHFQSANRPIN